VNILLKQHSVFVDIPRKKRCSTFFEIKHAFLRGLNNLCRLFKENIMTTIDLPLVQDCSVSECSYNNNGCAAGAVTIGYGRTCATFVPLSVRGGLERKSPVVGACQKADCSFNTGLECTASAIRVGSAGADCLTYQAR